MLVTSLSTFVILHREQFESDQSCLCLLKLTSARKDEVIAHLRVLGVTGLDHCSNPSKGISHVRNWALL